MGGMMLSVPLDLVIRLIEKSIDLLKERRDSRRHLFDVFIRPVYEEFEAVHKEYLASFAHYRQEIQEGGDAWVGRLVDIVDTDRLFTYGHRTKLAKMCESIGDRAGQDFITAIDRYTRSASDFLEGYSAPRNLSPLIDRLQTAPETEPHIKYLGQLYTDLNLPRLSLLILLRQLETAPEIERRISAEYMAKATLHMIDKLVTRLQVSFGEVTQEYLAVKKAALS